MSITFFRIMIYFGLVSDEVLMIWQDAEMIEKTGTLFLTLSFFLFPVC